MFRIIKGDRLITKRKILEIGGSKYVSLPHEFEAEPKRELLIIHNRLLGFALPEISEMDEDNFKAELNAVTSMLIEARKVLKAEKKVGD